MIPGNHIDQKQHFFHCDPQDVQYFAALTMNHGRDPFGDSVELAATRNREFQSTLMRPASQSNAHTSPLAVSATMTTEYLYPPYNGGLP